MTETNTPQVVRSYLSELDRVLAGAAADVRQGIVAGVAEELEGLDAAPGTPSRATEQRWYIVVTTVLMEFGGIIVPLAGWVAGIMMLWASPLWTRREKLVATIVPPAVGIVLFGVFAIGDTAFGLWHSLTLGALFAPILAAIVIGIVLSRRAWSRTA